MAEQQERNPGQTLQSTNDSTEKEKHESFILLQK